MKGMVPPSPRYAAGLPKTSLEALSSAAQSQGAIDGAFHPDEPEASNETRALYGGSSSSSFFM